MKNVRTFSFLAFDNKFRTSQMWLRSGFNSKIVLSDVEMIAGTDTGLIAFQSADLNVHNAHIIDHSELFQSDTCIG